MADVYPRGSEVQEAVDLSGLVVRQVDPNGDGRVLDPAAGNLAVGRLRPRRPSRFWQLVIERVVRLPHIRDIRVRTSVLEGQGTGPSLTMGDTVAAYHLERRKVPIDLASLEFSLFRNAAKGDEVGVRWFLERVAAAFDGLDESQ